MDKKQYQSPTVKVVSFRMEQGFANSGGALWVTHERFADDFGGHESFADNTGEPTEETNWFTI